ncbi:MAG: hypothetical protein LiPW30_758 [Parcubacteria group bacterium LiPW_30]|nr:MAG: hypothetical protein LiPW30_758 [Parcubacteria group bacterium LiPW_30]
MLTGWQIVYKLEKLAKDANYPERLQLESNEAIRLTEEGYEKAKQHHEMVFLFVQDFYLVKSDDAELFGSYYFS